MKFRIIKSHDNQGKEIFTFQRRYWFIWWVPKRYQGGMDYFATTFDSMEETETEIKAYVASKRKIAVVKNVTA